MSATPHTNRPTLTGRQRRALFARSHPLAPVATFSADNLGPAAVEHLRAALQHADLIKVRIQTDDREQFRSAVEQLVERVPCLLVKKVGRVAVLGRFSVVDFAAPT